MLDNGMVIGGHAGMIIDDLPDGEPLGVLQDMQLLIPGGANIVAIHLIGDIDDFHQNINEIIAENIPNAQLIPIIPHQQNNVPINVVVSGIVNWNIDILDYVRI